MGYFSNGTEGEIYEATFCDKCINKPDYETGRFCPIWEAHYLYNYEQTDNKDLKGCLNVLIPRRQENLQCSMFKPNLKIIKPKELEKSEAEK